MERPRLIGEFRGILINSGSLHNVALVWPLILRLNSVFPANLRICDMGAEYCSASNETTEVIEPVIETE